MVDEVAPLWLLFVVQFVSVLGDTIGQRCNRVVHGGSRRSFMLSMCVTTALQMFLVLSIIQLVAPDVVTGGLQRKLDMNITIFNESTRKNETRLRKQTVDVCSLPHDSPHYDAKDCYAQGPLTLYKVFDTCSPYIAFNGGMNIVYYVCESSLYREPAGIVLLVIAALASSFLVNPMQHWFGAGGSAPIRPATIILGMIGAVLCVLERDPPLASSPSPSSSANARGEPEDVSVAGSINNNSGNNVVSSPVHSVDGIMEEHSSSAFPKGVNNNSNTVSGPALPSRTGGSTLSRPMFASVITKSANSGSRYPAAAAIGVASMSRATILSATGEGRSLLCGVDPDGEATPRSNAGDENSKNNNNDRQKSGNSDGDDNINNDRRDRGGAPQRVESMDSASLVAGVAPAGSDRNYCETRSDSSGNKRKSNGGNKSSSSSRASKSHSNRNEEGSIGGDGGGGGAEEGAQSGSAVACSDFWDTLRRSAGTSLRVFPPFLLLSIAYSTWFVIIRLFDEHCAQNAWGYNAMDQVTLPIVLLPMLAIWDAIRARGRWCVDDTAKALLLQMDGASADDVLIDDSVQATNSTLGGGDMDDYGENHHVGSPARPSGDGSSSLCGCCRCCDCATPAASCAKCLKEHLVFDELNGRLASRVRSVARAAAAVASLNHNDSNSSNSNQKPLSAADLLSSAIDEAETDAILETGSNYAEMERGVPSSFGVTLRTSVTRSLHNNWAGFAQMFCYRLLINARAIAYAIIANKYDLAKSYLELTLIRILMSWVSSLFCILVLPRFIHATEREVTIFKDWVNISLKVAGSVLVVWSLVLLDAS